MSNQQPEVPFDLCTNSCTVNVPAIPPALPSRNTSNTDIILPKWVYIKDRSGRFLTQRAGPQYATLTFRSGDPDLECAFEAVRSIGAWYKFNARGDHPVMRYGKTPNWYSSDYPDSRPSYRIICTKENQVYLEDSYGPTRFFSNELAASGAPVGHDYINESSLMKISQASIKNEITNIQYEISGAKVREAGPVVALSTNVRNDSDVTVEQTLEYTYEKWSVGTWNNEAGIEIGASATFSAGVPFVVNAEFEISVTASFKHSWGGEDGERKVITSSTTVVVPPKKKARATIIVRNATIDVGFLYTQKILWVDGKSEEQRKTGIYTNVDSWHVDVVLDDWHDTSDWSVISLVQR